MQEIEIQGKKIHKWEVGPSTFNACIEQGARLMSWTIAQGGGSYSALLHWPEDGLQKGLAKVRGGNPLLFPFAGPSYDQGEIGFWRDERGFRRPYPQHGFTRQGKFIVTDLHYAGFSATFAPDEAAREGYPFAYSLTVTYRFEKLAFFVDLTLRNEDREPIPWGAGHHFYFQIPWTEGKTRADYDLILPHKQAARLNPETGMRESLPTLGKTVSLDQPELFNRIHTQLRESTVLIRDREDGDSLRITVNDQTAIRQKMAVVTWSESPQSPYYCVEPWLSPPNVTAEHDLLQWVPPGKSQTFFTEVRYLPAVS